MDQSSCNRVEVADNSLGQDSRRAWTTPKITRLRARDAEASANDIVEDGLFSFGS